MLRSQTPREGLRRRAGQLPPHLWYQLYWPLYLIWFFTLDAVIQQPRYILHAALDDIIPFCEWFIFPYASWFLLLAGVLFALWRYDTASYDKLCLAMFSGMTFCLVVYMIWPNGVDLRPAPQQVGRDNIAMFLMRLIWRADSSNNVCPSIHCQSTVCMAVAFCKSRLAVRRPAAKALAWVWAALICASTVFTKQHSVIDVACGVAVALAWYPLLYAQRPQGRAGRA